MKYRRAHDVLLVSRSSVCLMRKDRNRMRYSHFPWRAERAWAHAYIYNTHPYTSHLIFTHPMTCWTRMGLCEHTYHPFVHISVRQLGSEDARTTTRLCLASPEWWHDPMKTLDWIVFPSLHGRMVWPERFSKRAVPLVSCDDVCLKIRVLFASVQG